MREVGHAEKKSSLMQKHFPVLCAGDSDKSEILAGKKQIEKIKTTVEQIDAIAEKIASLTK